MGNSLFDQLKKSGLVDEKKAKKAKQGQYKGKQAKARKGTPKPVAESTLLAQQALADKLEKDRQLNQKQKDKVEQKAIAAQIKQLIETNSIKDRDGDIVYNFSDNNVVKQLHVSERVQKSLVSGRLAIARFGAGYELVPRAVADKIKQRDEHCIISLELSYDEPDLGENDPYADYKIPDDLMW